MKKIYLKLILWLEGFSGRWWYPLFVGSLTAIDAFIPIIPNEALLISAVVPRPKRWFEIALFGTIGNALGAMAFSCLASFYGEPFIDYFFPGAMESKTWLKAAAFIDHHSTWGLALFALSPFPQHPAVAIAGLSHVSATRVLASVFIGRAPKYFFFSWAAVHSKKLLIKWRLYPVELLGSGK